MSRPKSKRPDSFNRDVRLYWPERGYRAELAVISAQPGEDPKGEYAYQRAFLEAAQSEPPRLPNPNHYPNSQSAQAYIHKRNVDTTQSRVEKRPSEMSMDQQYSRKFRDPDSLPPSARKSASTSPASTFSTSSLPNQPSMMAPGDHVGYYPAQRTSMSTQTRLDTLEPRSLAPSGPTNKLR